MARKSLLMKQKGRREGGTFCLIPHAVMDSDAWNMCGGRAIRLLLDLARQYRGNNNGDLSVAMALMRRRGWTRDETVGHAKNELLHYGLIRLTRQGGLNRPNLYALTWLAIDECGGKLECPATNIPPGDWKATSPRFRRPRKKKKATTKTEAQEVESAMESGAGDDALATNSGVILPE